MFIRHNTSVGGPAVCTSATFKPGIWICTGAWFWKKNHLIITNKKPLIIVKKVIITILWRYDYWLYLGLKNSIISIVYIPDHWLYLGFKKVYIITLSLLTPCAFFAPTLARCTMSFLSPSCIPFSPAHACNYVIQNCHRVSLFKHEANWTTFGSKHFKPSNKTIYKGHIVNALLFLSHI